MAQSYLIFDLGANEESVQQARHRLAGWRQAFHLANKLEFRLERKEPAKKGEKEDTRIIVRLDFSEHEKLSHQRWLDRIPSEEPFKSAKTQIAKHGEAEFTKAAELFDSLDQAQRAGDRATRNR